MTTRDLLTLIALLLVVATVASFGGWHAGRMSFNAGRLDAIQEIARCTIAEAHAEKCWLPCGSEADCVQKNGQGDR